MTPTFETRNLQTFGTTREVQKPGENPIVVLHNTLLSRTQRVPR